MLTLSGGHGERRKESEIDCRSHCVLANGQINQEQCGIELKVIGGSAVRIWGCEVQGCITV